MSSKSTVKKSKSDAVAFYCYEKDEKNAEMLSKALKITEERSSFMKKFLQLVDDHDSPEFYVPVQLFFALLGFSAPEKSKEFTLKQSLLICGNISTEVKFKEKVNKIIRNDVTSYDEYVEALRSIGDHSIIPGPQSYDSEPVQFLIIASTVAWWNSNFKKFQYKTFYEFKKSMADVAVFLNAMFTLGCFPVKTFNYLFKNTHVPLFDTSVAHQFVSVPSKPNFETWLDMDVDIYKIAASARYGVDLIHLGLVELFQSYVTDIHWILKFVYKKDPNLIKDRFCFASKKNDSAIMREAIRISATHKKKHVVPAFLKVRRRCNCMLLACMKKENEHLFTASHYQNERPKKYVRASESASSFSSSVPSKRSSVSPCGAADAKKKKKENSNAHVTYKENTKPVPGDDESSSDNDIGTEIFEAFEARRSLRLKQKDDATAGVVKDYDECAAQIPDVKEKSEAADDLNRDEIVSIPKEYKLLEESKIHNYISACERKFFGDKHNALAHLAASEYSIKKALETIDSSESLPMIYIHENLGIWSNEEIVSFINMISNDYQWDVVEKKRTKNPFWIENILENFPNKSQKNCLNFYYTLKRAGFSFQTKSINDSSKFLSQRSNNRCVNCINQLWKLANQERYVSNLCGLCKLYIDLYGKQRPNAEALPFDLSILCSKEN